MLIHEWMTSNLITAQLDTSMLKISRQMKAADIKRVPIIDDEGRVLGIVTDKDVKDASPSKATTLDVHELYYLLSELKAKDVMSPHTVFVRENDTIEQVALLMEEKRVTGLPVLNDEDKLVGMITEHDIFKVLIEITGAKKGGVQVALSLSDAPGSLQPILGLLREQGARITSILTGKETDNGTMHDVYIRLHPMPKEKELSVVKILEETGSLRYYVTDKVNAPTQE